MRVLIVGVPRSGSSWVGEVLGRTEDACFVHEPDNPQQFPFALRALRTVPGGRVVVLAPNDDAPEYERLWLEAFGSRGTRLTPAERVRRRCADRLLASAGPAPVLEAIRESGQVPAKLRAASRLAVPARPDRQSTRVIAKSVYSATAVEWIAARCNAVPLLISRDPRNVVASWIGLGWLDRGTGDPVRAHLDRLGDVVGGRVQAPAAPGEGSVIARATWLVAVLNRVLEDLAKENPAWPLVSHEELCADPALGLRALAEKVGLVWTDETAAAVEELDAPGAGYDLTRVARDMPGAWHERLDPAQIEQVELELARFPR